MVGLSFVAHLTRDWIPPLNRTTTAFLQVIASIAVMISHSTAVDERVFQQTGEVLSFSFAGVLLNQLTRFTVPIFLMISGYGLAASQNSCGNFSLTAFSPLQFYGKRFQKVLLPYVFVSFVFLIPAFWSMSFLDGTFRYARALLLGDAKYHLYFMSILLQMYLLFPFLCRLSHHVLAAFLFVFHLFWMYPIVDFAMDSGVSLTLPPTSLFLYWVFYYHFGIYLRKYESIWKSEKISRGLTGSAMVILVLAFLWMMVEYIARSKVEPSPGMYNHFNRVAAVLFSISVFLIFYGLSERISLSKWGNSVGGLFVPIIYFAYLYHPPVLEALNHSFLSSYSILLAPVLIGTMYGTGWLIFYRGPNWALMRELLGLGPGPEKQQKRQQT